MDLKLSLLVSKPVLSPLHTRWLPANWWGREVGDEVCNLRGPYELQVPCPGRLPGRGKFEETACYP